MEKRGKHYNTVATQTLVGYIHGCLILSMGFVDNSKEIKQQPDALKWVKYALFL